MNDEDLNFLIFKRFWDVYPKEIKEMTTRDVTLVNIAKVEMEKEIRGKVWKEGHDDGLNKCIEIMEETMRIKKEVEK